LSTIKANALGGATTNSNLALTGNGSGVVTIGDGNLKFPDADGSANEMIITNGSAQLSFTAQPSAGFTELTPITTSSDTSPLSFTIPSGAEEIVLGGVALSFTGTEAVELTIGDAGGPEVSSYTSAVFGSLDQALDITTRLTSAFIMTPDIGNTKTFDFVSVLRLIDVSAFLWSCMTVTNIPTFDSVYVSHGLKALSAELTTVALGSTSGFEFDAGVLHGKWK